MYNVSMAQDHSRQLSLEKRRESHAPRHYLWIRSGFPVGVGKDAFWQNLLNGVSGAITLDRVRCCHLFEQHEFGVQVACETSDFAPGAHHVPPTYYSTAYPTLHRPGTAWKEIVLPSISSQMQCSWTAYDESHLDTLP